MSSFCYSFHLDNFVSLGVSLMYLKAFNQPASVAYIDIVSVLGLLAMPIHYKIYYL